VKSGKAEVEYWSRNREEKKKRPLGLQSLKGWALSGPTAPARTREGGKKALLPTRVRQGQPRPWQNRRGRTVIGVRSTVRRPPGNPLGAIKNLGTKNAVAKAYQRRRKFTEDNHALPGFAVEAGSLPRGHACPHKGKTACIHGGGRKGRTGGRGCFRSLGRRRRELHGQEKRRSKKKRNIYRPRHQHRGGNMGEKKSKEGLTP